MKIKTIASAMAAPYDEIVYRCTICNSEKKWTVLRPD